MVVSRSLGVAGPTAQRQVLIPFLGACQGQAVVLSIYVYKPFPFHPIDSGRARYPPHTHVHMYRPLQPRGGEQARADGAGRARCVLALAFLIF